MATVTIKNLESLTKKLNNIAKLDVKDVVKKATVAVHGYAKTIAPNDTGALAGSIRMKVKKTSTGYEGRVYTNLKYAMFVEFGTGVKGDGTYPYKINGVNLTYTDEPWCYWSKKEEKFIFTKGQVAQPFMYPALKNNEKYIKKLFKENVKEKLKDVCKGGN